MSDQAAIYASDLEMKLGCNWYALFELFSARIEWVTLRRTSFMDDPLSYEHFERLNSLILFWQFLFNIKFIVMGVDR